MTYTQLDALLYGRQSQDKDRSIAEQLDIGRDRADAEGWQVTGTYQDGVSASRHAAKKRDDWPKVLARIDAGHDRRRVLWLWESSRGDRKLSAWAAMLESCRDRDVLIYVETHRRLYDMAVAREWKVLADDGVDSEDETNKTSERVLRAMTANATAGQVHGRVPYGYRREYVIDRRGQRKLTGQVPDEADARVVRAIFRWIEAREPLLAITRRLNERGVRTRSGAAWSMQQVRGIALNRAYIGQRVHDPEGRHAGLRRPGPSAAYYPAAWPPLVDAELFWTVQRILTDPKRVTTRPGKAKHLLSMIARCDECGEPLSVTYRRRGGPHYICRRSCVLIGQAGLDAHVTADVLAYLSRPRVWTRLVAAGPTGNAELAEARAELAAIDADYRETKALFRARRISPAAFAEVEPGKLADLEAARTRVRGLETPPPLRFLLNGQGDLKTRWEAAPVAARRDVIRQLATVTVRRSPQRGPVRVPAAQRTRIEWITERVAPSGE
jgi:DNA invertase Pin-like site-specific DNA recombinase